MEEKKIILPEIPKNWDWTQLGILGKGANAIVDGPFGSNLKTSDYIDDSTNGVPVLTTKNLEGNYSESSVRFISKKKYEELKRSQVNGGDILVAKIGSIGKTGIYPINAKTAIIPANLLKFTVTDRVNFKFVFNYLNYSGFQKLIKSIARATAQPAFNVTKFRTLRIPVPSLPEQNKIVEKIEELFSELDDGTESLKKARQQLKIYRQAVLKYAFEGKLTEEWRARQIKAGNPPEPAEKLLDRIKHEREKHYKKQLEDWEGACEQSKADGEKSPPKPKKPKEVPPLTEKEMAELPLLPVGWRWSKIDFLLNFDPFSLKAGPFGSALKKSCYVRNGYKIYGQEQVIRNTHKYGDYYISEEKYQELITCKVRPKDILVSLVGTVGKILILPEEIEPGIINPRLIKISLNEKAMLPEFFKYYFESAFLKGIYELKTHGATMDILNLGIIQDLPFPFCSIPEQNQIISEIETRISVCDQLEQIIGDSLKKSDALRQSILKKAFEGDLTKEWREKHPELVSGENSAEKLLERIKAEKAGPAGNGKKQRTRIKMKR